VTTIPVGPSAQAVTVNPNTNMIYVGAEKIMGYGSGSIGSVKFSVPAVQSSLFVIMAKQIL
jgi:hypothetical protein